jgi:hypothetical protein
MSGCVAAMLAVCVAAGAPMGMCRAEVAVMDPDECMVGGHPPDVGDGGVAGVGGARGGG